MRTRTFIAAALLCAVLSTDADARQRRHAAIGRPAACAGIAWCGCWLRLRHGFSDARLNLARAWYSVGTPAQACRPGLIAVWPHHVGEITECLGGNMIRMISGNDGNAVRDRVRPLGRARLRAL